MARRDASVTQGGWSDLSPDSGGGTGVLERRSDVMHRSSARAREEVEAGALHPISQFKATAELGRFFKETPMGRVAVAAAFLGGETASST